MATTEFNQVWVTENLNKQLNSIESSLTLTLSSLSSKSGGPTQEDMLNMQKAFQQWSLFVNMIATVNKEMSDALKGIVAKV